MEERNLTIYSSKGKTGIVIRTNVSTRKQLNEVFDANEIDYSNMKVFDSVTKTSFDHEDSQIPEGDRILFLYQIKSNSGADTLTRRQTLYATIKQHIKDDGNIAKDHYCGEKHYTNKSTDVLEMLVNNYGGEEIIKEKEELDISFIEETVIPFVTIHCEEAQKYIDALNAVVIDNDFYDDDLNIVKDLIEVLTCKSEINKTIDNEELERQYKDFMIGFIN